MLPLPVVTLAILGAQAVAGGTHHSLPSHTTLNLGRRAKQAANPHRNALAAARHRARSTGTSSTAIWWEQSGWEGSCGVAVGAGMVGLPLSAYPDPSKKSDLCGSKLTVTSASGSVTLTVADASDRAQYTTMDKASFLALGGDANIGELDITYSIASASADSASTAAPTASASDAANAIVSALQGVSTSSTASATTIEPIGTEVINTSLASALVAAAGTTTTRSRARASKTASSTSRWVKSTRRNKSPKPTTTAAARTTASQTTVAKTVAVAIAATSRATTTATTSTTTTTTAKPRTTSAAAAIKEAGGDAAYHSTDAHFYGGAAGTVAADLLNANLATVTTAASSASATPNILYHGGMTWYAAFDGGYGSCGVKLYDGQETLPWVAMSLFEWMGAPGPSPHCFDCVEIHAKSNPSVKVTAIVADSCQACTFGHLDAEQALYDKLGGEMSAAELEIGWSFVQCPAGYNKEGLEKINPAAYVAVHLS